MKWNEEIKQQVAKTAQRSAREGMVAGTSGNVSAIDRATGLVYITPSNLDYSVMQPADIMVIDLNGSVLSGPHKPSSEWRLHAELYRLLPDAGAVVHTHSPYATSFAVVGRGIPIILVEMLPFLGGDIPVAEFGFPGTSEVGHQAAQALRHRNAALLQSHGVVAVGQTPQQAYLRAVYAEDAAKEYHLALQIGAPIEIDRDTVRRLREKYHLPQEE